MQLSDLEPSIAKYKALVASEDSVIESLRALITSNGDKAAEKVFLEKSGVWLTLSASAILTVVSNDRDANQAQLAQYQALYDQLQAILSGSVGKP